MNFRGLSQVTSATDAFLWFSIYFLFNPWAHPIYSKIEDGSSIHIITTNKTLRNLWKVNWQFRHGQWCQWFDIWKFNQSGFWSFVVHFLFILSKILSCFKKSTKKIHRLFEATASKIFFLFFLEKRKTISFSQSNLWKTLLSRSTFISNIFNQRTIT